MKNIILILSIVISASFSLKAQVEFKASISKDAVMVGEPFMLKYEININIDDFILPIFENFEVISGPSTSMQQSVNITNGEVIKTVSVTYTYYIKAKKEGMLTIQAAEIESERDFFQSNTVDVIVIKGTYNNPKEDKGKDIKGTSRL